MNYPNQDGYFLSPLDFLKDLFTFFLFSAAFNRFVLLRLLIIVSYDEVILLSPPPYGLRNYFTSQIPETIKAVPMTRERVTPSCRMTTLSKAVTNG